MMAWLFFANLFEPKKAAAIEHIQSARRLGNPADRAAATPTGRPNDRAQLPVQPMQCSSRHDGEDSVTL